MSGIAPLLRQHGYRLTRQRQQILRALTTQPRSVTDVVSFLVSRGITVDKATIYRTLERFVDLGIATKTYFNDRIAMYERIGTNEHHHHLVCSRCGSVEDVSLDERVLLREVNKRTNFRIHNHLLEFFGICAKCQLS